MFYVLCSKLKHIIVIIILMITMAPALFSAEEVYPKRIISLTPATTEILFALGLDDEIIAVSSYCSWPLRARKKEKAGSFSNPNIEKIISLKPDLVLVTGMEQEDISAILSGLGISYISVDPRNIDELMHSIDKIGGITGKVKQAEEINKSIKYVLMKIDKLIHEKGFFKKPGVYMEIWYDPVMSPGMGSFVDDMIKRAGGINVTSDLRRSYSRIDPEIVISRNPDCIILAYMKSDNWVRDNFSKRLGWKGITAVKEDRIYTCIDPDIVLRPGPRVAQGLMELYERFYEN
jgi:iron complex transport system substrate-binding protein